MESMYLVGDFSRSKSTGCFNVRVMVAVAEERSLLWVALRKV